MNRPIVNFLVLIAMAVAMLASQPAGPAWHPPADSRSVWDGVYTRQQAQRGESIYGHICASCHGEKLTGKESEDSPALTGPDFEEEWKGRTVGDLFRKILRKMPQDNPGKLSPQESVDLTAYILNFNNYPAGKAELPPQNEALVLIRFEAKKPEQK